MAPSRAGRRSTSAPETPLAPLALLIVEAPRIALAVAALGLLAVAAGAASGAVACLLGPRESPVVGAAPILLALLPAWLVTDLAPQIVGIDAAGIAGPAAFGLAAAALGFLAVLSLTRPGLVARAARIDRAAAGGIGLPLERTGRLALTAALLASLLAGAALALALPDRIAWLGVAAPAVLAARGQLLTGLLAAALGGAAGVAAIFVLQQPPAALAAALVLAAALLGLLRSLLPGGR